MPNSLDLEFQARGAGPSGSEEQNSDPLEEEPEVLLTSEHLSADPQEKEF